MNGLMSGVGSRAPTGLGSSGGGGWWVVGCSLERVCASVAVWRGNNLVGLIVC